MLSAEEMTELAKRCLFAQTYGYKIASAAHFAKELGYAGESPPTKVKKFSPAHLLHLISLATPGKGAAKFAKAGKAAKKAPPPPPPPPVNEDDRPTVPVDIRAVRAAVEAMRNPEGETPPSNET